MDNCKICGLKEDEHTEDMVHQFASDQKPWNGDFTAAAEKKSKGPTLDAVSGILLRLIKVLVDKEIIDNRDARRIVGNND